MEVAKVQKYMPTLGHTGFHPHVARQKHNFTKCVTKQKKGKAKARSESVARSEKGRREGRRGTITPGKLWC